MTDSLDNSYVSIISNEQGNSVFLNQEQEEEEKVIITPSKWAFIKGHSQYFIRSMVQYMFKDNNLPLLINIVYHLIAARALLFRPWKTVTRYLSIPPSTSQLNSNLRFQIEQTTAIAIDAFKAQGILHLALAGLGALALKERRQSSERSAMMMFTLSSVGQTWVHLYSYWKSNQQYTLKALQEVCTSDVFISLISTIALSKTVKRTGRFF